MSAVDNHGFDQAFPVIQEDDLFGSSSTNSPNMDVGDPFALATGASDPFSAFNAIGDAMAPQAVGNPFLDDTVNELSAPSNPTSRTATPIDELQSLRSDEAPWPGNNTAETTPNMSRDSAALSSPSDIAITQDHGCSMMDTSESSASSGRAIPNIALDSDSGNLTADANENACLPNTIYTLMDPLDEVLGTTSARADMPTPKITLTEASHVSERSSTVEAAENSTSNGDGHSRLLDSSEMETSQDHSSSNIASISSHDDSVAQVDSLSTMNISMINSASDGADSASDAQKPELSGVPGFFVSPETGNADEAGGDRAMRSELAGEVVQEQDQASSLSMPKTDRVFTSSPINPRRRSSVKGPDANEVLESWKKQQLEKISSKDDKEKKDIEKLKEQAKSDLEEWYRDRRAKIEAQHVVHLGNQDAQYAQSTGGEDKTIWQRMANLALELNQGHKVDEKRKDTTKMKYLLQLLAVRAPSLKQQP